MSQDPLTLYLMQATQTPEALHTMTETITDVPVDTDVDSEVETSTETDVQTVDGEVVSDVVEDEAPVEVKNKRNTRRAATKAEKDAKAAAKPVSKAVAVRKPKEVEKSELTPAAAKKLTEQLRKGLEHSVSLYVTAYSKRIWLALGHATWQAYLDAELGDLRPKLPKTDRKELEVQLLEAKMSSRAIASVIGVDQKTVVNDIAEMRADGTLAVESTRVVGTDGVEQTTERAEPTVDPEKAAKRFNDKVDGVFDKLDKYVGDLTELAADELFEDLAAEIATRHRADVARLVAALVEFSNRIQ